MQNRITKEGMQKLQQELEYLRNDKRKEVAEKLRHAISFGDLSENAAYSEAKEAQQFLEHRIGELSEMIKNSVVVEATKCDKVQIGATVTIIGTQKDASSAEEKYMIVGATEADPLQGKISPDSPLGKAMMGRKAGDGFSFETMDGTIKYKITKVE
jgi:transcription elongation factor GreA